MAIKKPGLDKVWNLDEVEIPEHFISSIRSKHCKVNYSRSIF